MSDAMLRWRGPDGQGGERALAVGACISIGRDPGCDLVVRSAEASRRHALLTLLDGGCTLQDSSANGTHVNGELLRQDLLALTGRVLLRVANLEVTLTPAGGDGDGDGDGGGDGIRGSDGDGNRRRDGIRGGDSASSGSAAGGGSAPGQGGHGGVGARAQAGPVDPRDPTLRRRIHARLLDSLDLSRLDPDAMDLVALRPRVSAALGALVDELAGALPPAQRATLAAELAEEALGLGPLESLLADPEVSEIMVVEPAIIYAERRGRLQLTDLRFTDDESARTAIERIVTPLGRRIDESTPLVDARLPDGSRVNAIIPPLASRGPCITIRKFPEHAMTLDDLQRGASLSAAMAALLKACVIARKNLVISGGTGSGKTTLLNVLSESIPEHERVVTIEDAAELRLSQRHVVSLESRPPNMEGRGGYSIRDLLKNALRMRPDRIVVGECRGGEAIDMLQAMNTGHEGSMTTTHANSPREAAQRLETLCLMAGLDLPTHAVRQQIASSVHVVVQQSRFADGARRITCISEVVGLDEHGQVELRDVYRYDVASGSFVASGYLPSFADELARAGLDLTAGAA